MKLSEPISNRLGIADDSRVTVSEQRKVMGRIHSSMMVYHVNTMMMSVGLGSFEDSWKKDLPRISIAGSSGIKNHASLDHENS